MALKLDDTTFRFLFASPAHFVGECSSDYFYLTVAFPSFDRRGSETLSIGPSPFRRSHFSLSVEVPEHDKQQLQVPTYAWIGEEFSALLGGFFGKLVMNFGHIQAGRLLTVPSLRERPFYRYDKPPFNDATRLPNGANLNLENAAPLLARYLDRVGEDEELPLLIRAAEFYRLALELYDEQPEMAFAMLISALEALTGLRSYSDEELYDEQLLADLDDIANHCPDGYKVTQRLRSRLYQVKRKVAALVNDAVPDAFFEQRETNLLWGFIQDRDELMTRVRAAYDIRSRLLHSGNRIGLWFIAHDSAGEEYGGGKPVLKDDALVKLLCRSVNLRGLERITATVLRTMLARWCG